MNWLKAHFARHRQRTPWSFCWRVSLESILVSLIAAIVVGLVFDEGPREFEVLPPSEAVFLIIIFAPVVETLFLQALPIGLAREMKLRFRAQILFSLVPFALLHFPAGIPTGVAAGIVGGFYLAFTYAHWAEKSARTALWVTMVTHALGNSPVLLGLFVK